MPTPLKPTKHNVLKETCRYRMPEPNCFPKSSTNAMSEARRSSPAICPSLSGRECARLRGFGEKDSRVHVEAGVLQDPAIRRRDAFTAGSQITAAAGRRRNASAYGNLDWDRDRPRCIAAHQLGVGCGRRRVSGDVMAAPARLSASTPGTISW